VLGHPSGPERAGHVGMVTEGADYFDQPVGPQEHQPPVAVVVGERTERLGSKGHLIVEGEGPFQRDGHGCEAVGQ
jgi:hypothetical protein